MHRPGVPRADTGLALALLRLPVRDTNGNCLFSSRQHHAVIFCDLLLLYLNRLILMAVSVSVPVHSSLLIPLTLPLAL